MKFQYAQYQVNDKYIYRPTVPITLKYKSKQIKLLALVDSGADFSIIPIEIADYLNVELDKDLHTKFAGAGDNLFDVYYSPVKISHSLYQKGFRAITWKTHVYFADHQPSILLGHSGFLEFFKVTFDGIKKEIQIDR